MFFKFVVPGLAVAAMAASAQTAAAPNIHVVEEIVAKVNGEIITRGELEEKNKEIEMMAAQSGLKGQARDQKVKELQADVLRQEIDNLLLVQKGKDMPGVTVDAEVTKYFNAWQTQLKFNDENKFHEFLQQQFGRSFEELKEQKKRELLAQRVIGYEVVQKISVPEAELQKYYDDHKAQYMRDEEVFLSQILISTEGKSPEQVAVAQQRATDLAVRARKGEKFSELARDNSDDPETAQNGGYLGAPMKRADLRPELAAIVFSDKAVKGYITDPPVKLPAGFLIIKVEEHYAAGQASFEEVREDVQQAITGPKMEPKVREYLTKLREQAFLQIKEGYVDTGAAPGKDTRWQEVAQLKPATTTKEEVLSSSKAHKKVLGVAIPGTTAEVKTLAETEKPPKPSHHKARPEDADPEARAAALQAKEDSSPPMPPIKQ
jgi:parvulin-like peptidyl-prolyl isomerase